MTKFRRTITRIGDMEINYSNIPEWCEGYDMEINYSNIPEWCEGYEFESHDFNGIKELGATYVRDVETGRIHSWESVERVDSQD